MRVLLSLQLLWDIQQTNNGICLNFSCSDRPRHTYDMLVSLTPFHQLSFCTAVEFSSSCALSRAPIEKKRSETGVEHKKRA